MAVSTYLIKDQELNLELVCEGDIQILLSPYKRYSIRVILNTVSFFFPDEDTDFRELILYIPLEESQFFLEIPLDKGRIKKKRSRQLIDLVIDCHFTPINNIEIFE